MEYDPIYTVSVHGKEFTLSKSQIEFDSPNYFTAYFLGGSREAKTRRLEIFRNQDLFSVVADYMCGLNVLPLVEGSITPTTSPHNALLNLRADATFYQLERLVQECDKLLVADVPKPPPTREYFILEGECIIKEFMLLESEGETEEGSIMIPWKPSSQYYTTEAKLREAPLDKMDTPETFNEANRSKTIEAIEGFVSRSVDNYEPKRWKLIGWHSWIDGPPCRLEFKWLVVLKDLSVAIGIDL